MLGRILIIHILKWLRKDKHGHFLACYINILSSSTFSLNTSTEENSEFYKKEKK